MVIDTVIIVGGGASLQEGIDLGLYDKIKDKCTIAINHEYKYFDSTAICFCDKSFYLKNLDNLKKYNLIIGADCNNGLMQTPNLYLLHPLTDLHLPINIKNGLYTSKLSGYFAISFAMYLLNNVSNIYLLGYDFTRRTEEEKIKNINAKTHCHVDSIHRGIGFTEFYENNSADDGFLPFLQETNIKIYNVSPNSNITCFSKLNYLEFFNKIKTAPNYNQQKLQNSISLRLQQDLK